MWMDFTAGFVTALFLVGVSLCLFVYLWLRSEVPSADTPLAFLRVAFGPNSYADGVITMRLTNEQRVLVTAIAVTLGGNPAPIDGAVNFTSSDESVARIDVVDDTSAYVTAVGPGAAQVFASFDADLGDGVRLIELSGAIEVVPAEAERGEIQFGAPELIPPPAE